MHCKNVELAIPIALSRLYILVSLLSDFVLSKKSNGLKVMRFVKNQLTLLTN